jgi:predicted phosphoribosyltransferase
VIVGVPVVPSRTLNLLRKEADLVVYIWSVSDRSFYSVEQFYEDFTPVSDVDVVAAKAVTQNYS